jgi:ribosomal protein L11 methyltransferase
MSRRCWPALLVRVADETIRDLTLAALDDHHPVAIEEFESDPHTFRVYFTSDADRERARTQLAAGFAGRAEVTAIDVADEGWAERSQASLRAVRVGRLIVAPPWDLPEGSDAAPGLPTTTDRNRKSQIANRKSTIVITPSMGFGTGHHATTRLCLEALQTVTLDGTSVIDVGTGSGVLGIAAARLGARHVVAIDPDPDAIACARENIDANGVAGTIVLAVTDVSALRDAAFDVLVANLTGPLLRAASQRLLRLTRPGGMLVLSGFLLEEEDGIAGVFSPPARLQRRADEGGWGVLVLRREA